MQMANTISSFFAYPHDSAGLGLTRCTSKLPLPVLERVQSLNDLK
jgi:hypothetical protein